MSVRQFCLCTALACLSLLFAAPRAISAIDSSGYLFPFEPNDWGPSTTARIGAYISGEVGDGEIQISSGSVLATRTVYLGAHTGVTGEATITGPGSQWNLGRDLYVGREGTGRLIVADSGVVTADALYVGRDEGGSLVVTDSGAITTGVLWGSVDDFTGDGVIASTRGAVIDAEMVFSGAGGTQWLGSFGSGGTLSVTADGGALGAGYKGRGSITIADGASIRSSETYLGLYRGASGEATVTGSGAEWQTGRIRIGQFGNGTLRVEGGAKVSSVEGILSSHTRGAFSPAEGTPRSAGGAIIRGSGSEWNIAEGLWVGADGPGGLTIADGGVVTAGTLVASLADLDGNGSVSVLGGALMDADLTFGSSNGGKAVTTFGSGGVLTVAGSGDYFGAGFKGTGAVTVSDGVQISSSSGALGYLAGSHGSATVSGAGSRWSNSSDNFCVGCKGDGTLDIEAGGRVETPWTLVALEEGADGRVTVTGTGSHFSSPDYLVVGYRGAGELAVLMGGKLSSGESVIAYDHSGTGGVTVGGSGSSWTNSSLQIGRDGGGRLAVESGGVVTSLGGVIGGRSGVGEVTVTGAVSQWGVRGGLSVGSSGVGVLTIADAGLVSVGEELSIDPLGTGGSSIHMTTGGMLAIYGITNGSLESFMALASGSDAIRYWDDTLADWAPIADATLGVDYTLEYIRAGDLAGYSVLTVGTPAPEPTAIMLAIAALVGRLTHRRQLSR